MKKFTTKFESYSKILAKDIVEARKNISNASLEKLKPLAEIKLPSYDKLVPVAFDLAVVNMFNRNGDGVSTKEAKAIAAMIPHHPINIEHYRSDVCGHVISAGFFSKADHSPISEDDLPEDDTYYLSVGGILYAIVRSGLVDFVRWQKEDDAVQLCASWEIAFDEYEILKGNNILSKCEKVEGKEEIAKYEKFLKCNGGTGFDEEGLPVFRKITGEVEPVGVGLTFTPAADVKGIYTIPQEELEKQEEEEEEEEEENDSKAKNKNNISQKQKTDVVASREQNMTLEQIKALIDDAIKAISAKGDTEKDTIIATASATAVKQIEDAIKTANDQYIAEKNALATLKAESETKQKESDEKIAQFTTKLAEIEAQLATANEKILSAERETALAAKAARIDSTMAEFDAKFNLTKEERDIALAELSGTDVSDAAVESFKTKYGVIFASKVKTATPSTDADKELSTASASGAAITSSQGASDKLSDKIKHLKLEVSTQAR